MTSCHIFLFVCLVLIFFHQLQLGYMFGWHNLVELLCIGAKCNRKSTPSQTLADWCQLLFWNSWQISFLSSNHVSKHRLPRRSKNLVEKKLHVHLHYLSLLYLGGRHHGQQTREEKMLETSFILFYLILFHFINFVFLDF